MKNILSLIFIVLVSFGEAKTVSVRVVDDLGLAVPEADVKIWFCSNMEKPSDRQEFKSNADGRVTAHGETIVGYFIRISKSGYYSVTSEPYIAPDELVEKTYVLARVINPVSLYANRFNLGSGRALTFPMQGVWIGYDFEVGDWVSPQGKGNVTDIQFKFKNELRGWTMDEKKMASARRANSDKSEAEIRFFYGQWDGVLEIAFPNPKEGISEDEKNFLFYSELKLPHLAPESGYEPTRRYEASTYKGQPPDRQVGFFLRTRVQLDAKGNIISANYAKIYGDISFDARGTLQFGYYYNPKPNDRNLEFDRSHNLFPKSSPGSDVRDP